MATITLRANGSTTIGYAVYNSSTWKTGSSNGACQGAYKDAGRVGVMWFMGAEARLKAANITEIRLTITCSNAGSSSSSKKLSFRKAKYQFLNTSVTGSAQVGDALGTLTGKFYDNTVTHTLNASSNAALFNAMSAYFAAGNSTLVLYNGETSNASATSSTTHYARVTACALGVTYSPPTVWYCNGGTWKQCTVWYCNGGTWKQCVPYYRNGNTWVRV